VTPALEIFVIRTGPDGLTRITARCLGEGTPRTWVVPAAEAQDSILDDWGRVTRPRARLPAVVVS